MTVQPSPFIPGADASNPRWTGKRKKIQRSAAIHMRWGSTFKECEEAFADWHHCALQIVHAENISFRLLAFVRQHLNMKAGTISGTNFEFAKMGRRLLNQNDIPRDRPVRAARPVHREPVSAQNPGWWHQRSADASVGAADALQSKIYSER
ncbi:hypothetical protein NKJ71_19815 [Mesorhizobium sp. M0050]|uniref:hypothetical protein n=1 Tax=Mesorhizobium sp. M0050 TaxID=2956861 RepID=UPI00333C8844